MRALIQRVKSAEVRVEDQIIGSIKQGILIFLGVGQADDEAVAERLWNKISKLRIFEDAEGKTNLSLSEINGSVLVVSQFTLYANCRKGNRPSFIAAASPSEGERLYNYFCHLVKASGFTSATGSFGADMKIKLINDGPFTIWLDSEDIAK